MITNEILDCFLSEQEVPPEEKHDIVEPYEEEDAQPIETIPVQPRSKVPKRKQPNEDMPRRTRNPTHSAARLGRNRDSDLGILPRTPTKPRGRNRKSNS